MSIEQLRALSTENLLFGVKVFVVNLMKVTVEDRQVKHMFESNATSVAHALNVACNKCLAGNRTHNICAATRAFYHSTTDLDSWDLRKMCFKNFC